MITSCLITGSSGFLGKVLVQHLSVNTTTKTLSRSEGDYIADLQNTVPNLKQKFDLIIHAAGLAHNIDLAPNSNEYYKVNVIGTKNLIKSLDIHGIPEKFVFISSVSVYGLISGVSIYEKDDLIATDSYGKSKLEAENLILDWCKKNNVKCTILRLPLVVGSNPPGNLATMINGIRVNRYFNVAGGKARKSMVLAKDIAEYILKAAEVGGVYNLTDGYHPSFFEISKNIALQLGKREPRNLPMFMAKLIALIGNIKGSRFPINSKKLLKITSTLTFDDTKAREAFGWNPTPVLEGFKISDIDL